MDPVLKQHPSFGALLRALRLGYRWEERYGCFVRLSGGSRGEPPCLELAPASGPPSSVDGSHRCYWESPDKGASLLAMIQPLQELAGRVERYQSIYLTEEGGAAPQTS